MNASVVYLHNFMHIACSSIASFSVGHIQLRHSIKWRFVLINYSVAAPPESCFRCILALSNVQIFAGT